MACSVGNIEKIKKFIEVDGCDPMKPDLQGFFPLHLAVISNKKDCVDLLLNAYKCNPNVVDSNAMTPLHHAAQLGLIDIIKTLVAHPDIDLVIYGLKLKDVSLLFTR